MLARRLPSPNRLSDYFSARDDQSIFNQRQASLRSARSGGRFIPQRRLWWASFTIPRVRFFLHAAFLVLYLLILTFHIGGGFTGWHGMSKRQHVGQLRPELWNFARASDVNGWDYYELAVELAGWVFTFSRWVEEMYQLSVSGSLSAYLSDGWNRLDTVGFFFMNVALHQRVLTWADGGTGWLLASSSVSELLSTYPLQ